ncbi:MAG: signal transduction histidine kinase [Candidatus Krumholzibacteriia bacterium]|jgi:signal transduction histidine kinase
MYRLAAVLAICLGLWAFSFQARLSALPPDLDLSTISWPVPLEGVMIASEDQAHFQAEGFPIGTEIQLGLPNDSPQTVIVINAHSRPYLLVTLISGLFFWTVSMVVFTGRADQQAVPVFFWLSILYETGVLVGGVYGQNDAATFAMLRSLMQLASLAFLPATFMHMSLTFPTNARLLIRLPRLPLILYAIATALVAWQWLAFYNYFSNPAPSTWVGLSLPQRVADTLLVVQVLVGFMILLSRARGLDDARQRQQLRWLILGFVLGSAPYVFLRTLPSLFGLPALLPAYMDRVLELAVPAGFVFSVVRYRFLDIDIILRRGLLYGFLAASLAVLVVLPILLLGPGWTDPWPMWWRVVTVLCGLMAGALYRPLLNVIGRGVDRAFFKLEHQVEKNLREIQSDLDTTADVQDMCDQLARSVTHNLHVECCMVLVRDKGEIVATGNLHPHKAQKFWDVISQEMICAHDPILAFFDELGFSAMQTLCVNEYPIGAVVMGPKTTNRAFIRSDLEFLANAAELGGRQLEKMQLAQTVVSERLKQQHLEELSELKDDFLTRVAHDLRTPVTSVGWSIRNLKDGLAGELNTKQSEYLASINDAMKHLAALVTNLLEISRLEYSKITVVCESLDPGEVVSRAVGSVWPLAEAKGVSVRIANDGPDQVFANDEKLVEVLVNLLENAVRFSPEGGEVIVSVKPLAEEMVEIGVRDQGPGLGGLANPFGRFVQGASSPDGSKGGYGLGLTIAHELVELMHGEIHGGDHAAGGAVFTIHLNQNDQSGEKQA